MESNSPFENLTKMPASSSTRTSDWEDLQQVVKDSRRLSFTLSSKTLTSFTFRHVKSNSTHRTRIYFLGIPTVGFMRDSLNTLLYVDIPSSLLENPTESNFVPEWHELLESFYNSKQNFSKEEQLLRERKRLGSFGITSYDVDIDHGRFLFPACNTLFTCEDSMQEGQLLNHSVFPSEIKSSSSNARMDSKLCPVNPNLVGFIHYNDLWVTSVRSKHEVRLTFLHKNKKARLADNPRSAGVPSFVMQEEFDRYTGYWWQPKQSSELNTGTTVYRILYEEVDESDVPILNIVPPSSNGRDIEEHRYPRPGQANAKSCLGLVEFQLDEDDCICSVVNKRLTEPLWKLYPDTEYLVRAGWTADGTHVWAELLNRLQTKLQLVLISLDGFTESCVMSEPGDGEEEEMPSLTDSIINTNSIQTIYQELSPVWINVNDSIYFFRPERASELSFIWSSEKSGYRHLYLVTVSVATPANSTSVINRNGDQDKLAVLKEVQLTSGDWMVLPKEIFVDECRKLVYFTGLKDTPLESHLYVVSYDRPGEVVRLTELGASHTVSIDKECSMFVTVKSNISTPTSSQLYQLQHRPDSGLVQARLLCTLLEAPKQVEGYEAPELFSYVSEGSGDTRYGMVFRPHDLEVGETRPTVLYVYGGPQVQTVSNAFKGHRYLRLHTLASLGYAVVAIDSRGSACRGLEFESAIKDRLGEAEIADQMEGLRWLASQVEYIDLDRVAIHGWSYGGYLSLMGLVKHPEFFKVAIAGAPVTDWRLYDTGYTERYLKLPTHQDSDAYTHSSVLSLATQFPTQPNRLLIIQGLMDENVHFCHTSSLITALVKAGKPYQLQVYPEERHGIRSFNCHEHYETVFLSFLKQHL